MEPLPVSDQLITAINTDQPLTIPDQSITASNTDEPLITTPDQTLPVSDESFTTINTDQPLPIPDQPLTISYQRPKFNKYTWACSFLAATTYIMIGYDMGVMSGAMPFIEADLDLGFFEVELIAGAISVFSLLGSLAARPTSARIGRRYVIVLIGVCFISGTVLMVLARKYYHLMLGRFLTSISLGFVSVIVPAYTAEVAPSSHGFFISFPKLLVNFGILLGYISNFGFSKLPTHIGWRVMLGLIGFPFFLLVVGYLVMPESPLWLSMQGRLGEAKRVLDKISNSPEESQTRSSDIKRVVVGMQQEVHGTWHDLLTQRRTLLCAIGINFFDQATGIEAVQYFSPMIFEEAGIKTETHKLLATISVGLVKTLAAFVAKFLVGKVRRRRLILISVGGMVVSLAGIGTVFYVVQHMGYRFTVVTIALCICPIISFVAFYWIGMGPVVSVYTKEIFPRMLRSKGCGVAMATNRVTGGLVTMSFIIVSKIVSVSGSFFMYTLIAVVTWVFVYTLCPETKGDEDGEDEENVFQ